MFEVKSSQQAAPLSIISRMNNAVASVSNLIKRIAAPDTKIEGTSDLWKLYQMSRGSDSLRPSVVRKLHADAHC